MLKTKPAASRSPESAALRQEAIDWFVALRSGDLSEEELNAFADWLARDGSHVAAFADAERLFAEMSAAAGVEAFVASVMPADPVAPRLPRFAARRMRRIKAGLALAASWLISVHLALPAGERMLQDSRSDLRTRVGEIREVPLTDGSRLVLDTDTAVSTDLHGPTRRVVLRRGRIHVKVGKDPARAFEVATERAVVRALGTAFDVRRLESGLHVTVQEHSVAVRLTDTDGGREIGVAEGQRLIWHEGEALAQPAPLIPGEASSWPDGRLWINDRPLAELLSELERYRTGRIFVTGKDLESLRVTGVFSLERPEETLRSICKALSLEQSAVGPLILLHR